MNDRGSNKRMTRRQKGILSFLALLVCLLASLAVWLWQGRWQQPLGPALQIASATPFTLPYTWTPDPAARKTVLAPPTVAPGLQGSPIPSLTPAVGLCGAPPVMNILAIGTDAR